MTSTNIIFDLDGTLVDSAAAILSSIDRALMEVGVQAERPLTDEVIGPPIDRIVATLLTGQNKNKLSRVLEIFRRDYDERGYNHTLPYPGVNDLLEQIRQHRIPAYIATNKRNIPTQKILRKFRWEATFEKIYTIDGCAPTNLDKADMLSKIARTPAKGLQRYIYVGDRSDDAQAAEKAGVEFVWAMWGYESDVKRMKGHMRLERPADLFSILNK